MDALLWFILLVLAVWRVTSLLYREDGPWDMFAKFRSFMGVYYDETSQPQGRNVLASALTCFWCSSVYVALPAAFFLTEYNPLIVWLAVSGGAIFVDEIMKRG